MNPVVQTFLRLELRIIGNATMPLASRSGRPGRALWHDLNPAYCHGRCLIRLLQYTHVLHCAPARQPHPPLTPIPSIKFWSTVVASVHRRCNQCSFPSSYKGAARAPPAHLAPHSPTSPASPFFPSPEEWSSACPSRARARKQPPRPSLGRAHADSPASLPTGAIPSPSLLLPRTRSTAASRPCPPHHRRLCHPSSPPWPHQAGLDAAPSAVPIDKETAPSQARGGWCSRPRRRPTSSPSWMMAPASPASGLPRWPSAARRRCAGSDPAVGSPSPPPRVRGAVRDGVKTMDRSIDRSICAS